ncbi:MAG: hypothetical protein DRP09_13060 [Candidatus Thorarchaeota archaeon]|nr:MAG: hypothetical protein DRP09_13060 [Candidatus Thorarchaeota archaeon]
MADPEFLGDIEVRLQDPDGNTAEITADGRLKVSQEPPSAPPDTTSVSRVQYSSVTGTSDDVYTIPSGEELRIQRFAAGAEHSRDGSVVELWYDPNGNGTGMTIIDVLFVSGSSNQHDLNAVFTGNGTRAIRMRRRRLDGGARRIFARWEGYY